MKDKLMAVADLISGGNGVIRKELALYFEDLPEYFERYKSDLEYRWIEEFDHLSSLPQTPEGLALILVMALEKQGCTLYFNLRDDLYSAVEDESFECLNDGVLEKAGFSRIFAGFEPDEYYDFDTLFNEPEKAMKEPVLRFITEHGFVLVQLETGGDAYEFVMIKSSNSDKLESLANELGIRHVFLPMPKK